MGFLQNGFIAIVIFVSTLVSGTLGLFHLSRPEAVPLAETTATTTQIEALSMPGWIKLEKPSWDISYPQNLTLKDHPDSNSALLEGGTLAEDTIILNYAPLSLRAEGDILLQLVKQGRATDLAQAAIELQQLSIELQAASSTNRTEFVSSRLYTVDGNKAGEFVERLTTGDFMLRTTFANANNLIDIALFTKSLATTSKQIQTYDLVLQTFHFK